MLRGVFFTCFFFIIYIYIYIFLFFSFLFFFGGLGQLERVDPIVVTQLSQPKNKPNEIKQNKTNKKDKNKQMNVLRLPPKYSSQSIVDFEQKRACSHLQTFLDQELRVQNSWSTKWHDFSDKKVSIWKPKP